MAFYTLKCALCGREFPAESTLKTCPDCGIHGTMHVLYDYDEVKKQIDRTSLAFPIGERLLTMQLTWMFPMRIS